jgi:hypothetical protein
MASLGASWDLHHRGCPDTIFPSTNGVFVGILGSGHLRKDSGEEDWARATPYPVLTHLF